MTTLRRSRLVALKAGRTPPTELLLIPYGTYRTTKGDFRLTRVGAQRIMARLADEGLNTPDRGITIDWEHDSLTREPGDGPADSAGWFNVELRADGLWATNIRWTSEAAEKLATAKYRYVSPAFSVDEESGEVLSFVNFALTNHPATKSARPLVAASRRIHLTQGKSMHKKFLAKLAAKMKDQGFGHADMKEKHGVDTAKYFAEGAEPPTQEEMAKLAKGLGFSMDDDDDGDEDDKTASAMDGENVDDVEPSDDSAPAGAEGKKKPTTSSDESVDVPGEDKEQKLAALVRAELGAMLVKLTGEKNPSKAAGILLAQKEKAMRFDDVEKKLALMAKEREAEKRERLIELGKVEKKLTPSLVKLFSKKPVDELEAFLECAPVIEAGAEFHPAEPGTAVVSLTREDREVAELLNRDPEDVSKFKQAELAGKHKREILATYTARPKQAGNR